MASRVVRPETLTLSISNGDWLLVKKRLNHGERQDAFARKYLAEVQGVRVNLQKIGLEKITAYLLDWSLVGLDGAQLVIRDQPIETIEGFLNAIDDDSFKEISDAIDAHDATMQAERDAIKKPTGGENSSSAISPSPVAVAGDIATSVN